MVAVCCYVLCYLYSSRRWNFYGFETFYASWDFCVAYLIEFICLLIFFPLLLVFNKSLTNKLKNILSWFSFIIVNLGCIAIIITIIANTIGLRKAISDYRLDCQLQSDNKELFHESIDAIIPLASNARYCDDEPNEYMLKAARDGYPKAQNAMGCFYHERAKINLSNGDSYNDKSLIAKSESDFDHAIYWFLKAAQNNNSAAQTNLGRIFMGDLASNRFTDISLAKQWLLKACSLNDLDAFFYLGKIYSNENLRDAWVYWSKGAELGSEDCARELEKPEFANGIPDDKKIVQAEEAFVGNSNAY